MRSFYVFSAIIGAVIGAFIGNAMFKPKPQKAEPQKFISSWKEINFKEGKNLGIPSEENMVELKAYQKYAVEFTLNTDMTAYEFTGFVELIPVEEGE